MCGHSIEMFANKSLHDAMTERSPAYAILGVDSEDRFRDYEAARAATGDDYNSSPYNFQITKNESIMNGFFTRLAVTEINMPWMIPNINGRTYEIGVEYQIGAGPIVQASLQLNYGFYTPAEIAAQIEAEVQALDPALAGFQMNYGNPDALGVLNATDIPVFAYSFPLGVAGCFLPLPYNTPSYPFPPTVKQLFDLLGFTDENTVLDVGGSTGRSTYCQAIRYVDIVCSQLTYNQALKDTMTQTTARDTLCRLYIGDGPYTGTSTLTPSDPDFCPPGCAPFTIYRQFTNPKFIRWIPNQPVQGNLLFEVFDDNGERLDNIGALGYETDGGNWSMTLLVSED
jgi:hypothetical protein